jgi:hypothetical protein
MQSVLEMKSDMTDVLQILRGIQHVNVSTNPFTYPGAGRRGRQSIVQKEV